MAEKVRVELIDDLDGSEAHETIQFGLDGVAYEIDLSDHNAAELRNILAPYTEHGRRASTGRKQASRSPREPAGSRNGKAPGRNQNRAIREWAREQGYDLPDRGRIPKHIVDSYHQSTAGSA